MSRKKRVILFLVINNVPEVGFKFLHEKQMKRKPKVCRDEDIMKQ